MRHEVTVPMMPVAFHYSVFRLRYRVSRPDVSDVMVAVVFVRLVVLDVAVAKFSHDRKKLSKKEIC